MPPAIEINGLTKTYRTLFGLRQVTAVDDLNLTVEEGEVFGFLGPNGAGKTTTIKILLGIIYPTAGECKLFGERFASNFAFAPESANSRLKANIGYLPEGPYFHEFLSGREVLSFYGKLYGLRGNHLKSRIDETLDIVGMQYAADRLVQHYSKGMRQRIGLAQALLSDPKLMILDEPTVGLDPIARREIRDLMIKLRNLGKTLFVCSHELSEVEMICNKIAIINRGKMVTHGKLLDLMLQDRAVEIDVTNLQEAVWKKLETEGCFVGKAETGLTMVRLPENRSLYQILDILKADATEIVAIRPKKESLEDLFIRSVKEEVA
ncbi:MAG: ABC transporter ATP-binding protein [Candidatus Abyssobacteria bacterium SURF_5]|uniref:ABC transporter ATP-binding protein n=1 Tax=Abyssobacteria bacterium (strain SURF_5) TaxID=2093360 RepID=A0A3A4MUM9_ABYX5|nr:MAG: ABC transporter ATP-binding protein [Candidatus Abyssubacteria bacterium SURF_5]